MTKVFTLVAVASVITAASLSIGKAETRSLSCQSVNGQTLCLSSSRGTGTSLSCQTINGKTTCVGSGGLRCQTGSDGRLACSGGDGSTRVEIYPPDAGNGGTDDGTEDGRFLQADDF